MDDESHPKSVFLSDKNSINILLFILFACLALRQAQGDIVVKKSTFFEEF